MWPPRNVLISALLALALIVTMRFVSTAPADTAAAEAYHAQVKEAAAQIPQQVGPWRGVSVEVPEAAVTMLKPNVIVSRRYVNEQTGRSITLLLVQCGDARDMEGHYPPNCYPANGWKIETTEPFELSAAGRRIEGQTYTFGRQLRGLPEQLTVMNVIMLPSGRFGRGMAEVRRLAGAYRDRFYGAGQLQFVFGGGWGEDERRETARLFLDRLDPVIDAIFPPIKPAQTPSPASGATSPPNSAD